MPVRNSASGIFGVITLTRLSNSSRTNFRPEVSSNFGVARRRTKHGIENDMFKLALIKKFGDDCGVGAIGKHADLHAGEFDISISASSCARSVAEGVACTDWTPWVD